MLVLWIISLFILWLCFWSLASVLVTRLDWKINFPTIKWIFIGRSKCPKCGSQLKVKNLIPLISYFYQKWKCSKCKEEISRVYPVLEISSAIVFVATFLFVQHFFGWDIWLTVFWLIINRLLVSLLIFDIWKYELHVVLRAVTLLTTLLVQFFAWYGSYVWAFRWSILFWFFFYIIYFFAKWYIKKRHKISHEGIWEWDAMLAFLIWTLMPFVFEINNIAINRLNLINLLVIFLVLSSLLWLLFVVLQKLIRIPFKQAKKGQDLTIMIPFLPSMIVSFWILLLIGDFIINIVFWWM